MFKLLFCCIVIVLNESQNLVIGTGNNRISGVVGYDVQLKWDVPLHRPYSIYKVENELTTNHLEDRTKYTHELHGTGIVVTIKSVTLDDAGIYTCEVDVAGVYIDIYITTFSSNIELTVIDWEDMWISTTNPVVSRLYKDVELVWKYRYPIMVREITFIRYNNITEDEYKLGVWTAEDGFKTDVRNVEMVKTIDEQNVELRLTLENVMKDDVNLFYICQVSDGKNFNQNGIQLDMEKPKVYSNPPVIKDDVIEFEWHYEYDYPAHSITFTRHLNAEPLNVGYWTKKKFNPTLDGGKDRVKFDKKDRYGGVGADLTLKLLNVTRDDFSYIYTCKCVFIDSESTAADVKIGLHSAQSYRPVQNKETAERDEEYNLHAAVNEDFEGLHSAQSYRPVQKKETAETDEEDESVQNEDSGFMISLSLMMLILLLLILNKLWLEED
ncbi:hypothetical protein SNE40_006298 [Patella caerulea]|uniref:Immunoglobulin domain-containing protein n=1 Tax=Patella caerulea TaxID=87958 RepID=A0AAN8PZN8_PATCE